MTSKEMNRVVIDNESDMFFLLFLEDRKLLEK